jgi:hypothetical protein
MSVRLALSFLALSGVAGAQLLFGPSQATTFAPLPRRSASTWWTSMRTASSTW